MQEKRGDKLTKEASVSLENVNFRMLITLKYWSKGERPVHETLLHNHVFHELFVCKQGEINIKTADGDILLGSGDIAIIPPTKFHVLRYTGQDTQGYIIPFLCKKIGTEANINLYKKLLPIINNETYILRNSFDFIAKTEKIVEEFFSGATEKFLVALHLLELFLKIAEDKKHSDVSVMDKRKNEAVSNDIERMMKLDGMIASRYLQKCTASDYAKELFISTRQLDRIVIKRYGKPLHQLIADRRFTLAKQLLTTTELTIEAVASSSGFSSSARLYKEFKKRHGVTPAAFRENSKNL